MQLLVENRCLQMLDGKPKAPLRFTEIFLGGLIYNFLPVGGF